MNTTDREEQLVELVYSVLGYEHADNITKCRHVANKILAWHEQKVAEEREKLGEILRQEFEPNMDKYIIGRLEQSQEDTHA